MFLAATFLYAESPSPIHPFPHVYFAKNVANIIFPLILGSAFSDCVVFYGDKSFIGLDLSHRYLHVT